MKNRTPVVMIGLDAVEMSLVDRLCDEGKLPTLQSLRENGCFGILQSDAHLFAGGVWPTFYTAKQVPWHGIYHNKLWRYEKMRCEVADSEWLPDKPFWEYLNDQQYRIAIVDAPMTLSKPRPLNGIHLCGWGTHDLISKGAVPPELWKTIEGKFGSPRIPPEFYGPQTFKTLKHLRKQLLSANRQMINICEYLLSQEPWDLFLMVFGAAHRAGHYLWDLSQIDTPRLSDDTHLLIEGALQEIYQSLDEALAVIKAKTSAQAKVVVFAVHGMSRNPGWSDYCHRLLTMIQQKDEGTSAKSGLLYKLKQALPWQLIRQVTQHMPKPVLDRLVSLWSSGMFDWSQTHYFPLPMDHAGYIRINLKGREPQGIVECGPEYNQICAHLEEALLSFRDSASGKPIVDKVYRLENLAPADATFRNNLPDLVVTWSDISAIESKGIYSEQYGELQLDGRLPSGRAGNHTKDGWFIACGQGIPPGFSVQGCKIVDLVPTLFQWLNAPLPNAFQGHPIPDLCLER